MGSLTSSPTTPAAADTVETTVYDVLVLDLGIDRKLIEPEAHIVNDLGADSLDVVELLMAIEERFGIELDDDEFIRWFEPGEPSVTDPQPGTIAFLCAELTRRGAVPKPAPVKGW
jgi:acyl carrier protein